MRIAKLEPGSLFLALVLLLGLALAAFVFLRSSEPAAPPDEAQATAALFEDLIGLSADAPFGRPSTPWQLSLPGDHGAHPSSRAESWMISAHLSDPSGTPVGVTAALSRFGLRPPTDAPGEGPWDIRALYRAQTTLAHGNGPPLSEERLSRGNGTAGHDPAAGAVWLDHWQLTYREPPDGKGLHLSVTVDGVPVRLSLTPVRGPRAMDGGDEAPFRGFLYPRMRAEGAIGVAEEAVAVSGYAWLDRAWGELPMPGGPLAYSRLILHLDDGTDISVVRTARRDGRGGATIDGLILTEGGDPEALSEENLQMTPGEEAGALPVAWRVEGAGLDLGIAPLAEGRKQAFLVPGWTGTVSVSGLHGGRAVSGLGTLQLNGYEE